jgi:hypothetical protein
VPLQHYILPAGGEGIHLVSRATRHAQPPRGGDAQRASHGVRPCAMAGACSGERTRPPRRGAVRARPGRCALAARR